MFWKTIDNLFSTLPGGADTLLFRLRTRLRFGGCSVSDTIDEHNARLVCAVLSRNSQLFLCLPDARPRRPALLFATGLIRHWLDSRELGRSEGPVLYFGTTVGIRDHLALTTIHGMRITLAEVFRQQNLTRGGREGPLVKGSQPLPQVITAYAPTDPAAMIERYRPKWIAADCGDAPRAEWVHAAVQAAREKGLPVVAWGRNPLSECTQEFIKTGTLITWPPSISGYSDLEAILSQPTACELQPLLLEGPDVEAITTPLQNATRLLAQSARQTGGPLTKDSIAIHYRYLRALENLAVPFDFHEVEAPRFWGLKSFNQIRAGCESFRKACGRLLPELAQASAELDRAAELLRQAEPPLWSALGNLTIEGAPKNQARLITFSSAARKQLFLYALLARLNLTEDDLRSIGTWVVSLEDLRRWERLKEDPSLADGANPGPSLRALWHCVLAGAPSPTVATKLLPVILQPQVEVVVHPHQTGALSRLAKDFTSRLNETPANLALLLKNLTNNSSMAVAPRVPPRIAFRKPLKLTVKEGKRIPAPDGQPIWAAEDPVKEVARLLSADGYADDEDAGVSDQAEPAEMPSEAEPTNLWCDEAMEVQFDQNLMARFAPEEQINLIVSTANGIKVEERFVRSLKPNDRVLFIDGLRRQNLYELIISRVHRHPSIELHLAMISRWQHELKMAFNRWRLKAFSEPAEPNETGPRDVAGLLKRLQAQGSAITCELTISFWLDGTTLCPIDDRDLRRVADILDLDFVRQNYRRIDQAASRLRGLHRGLSKGLNRWLGHQATKLSAQDDDDMIAPELGLRFGDIRNSLHILRVLNTRLVKGPFLREQLGKLYKEQK